MTLTKGQKVKYGYTNADGDFTLAEAEVTAVVDEGQCAVNLFVPLSEDEGFAVTNVYPNTEASPKERTYQLKKEDL